MRNLITIIVLLLGFNFGYSQEFNEVEKKQIEIIKKGILDANKQEKIDNEKEEAKKPEKIIKKGVVDTIVYRSNYEVKNNKKYKKDPLYKKLEHISFEVKDGIMFAKFRADLEKDIVEDSIINNYKKVKSATKRTIKKGDDKVFVYATPATQGTFLSTQKWGWSVGLLSVPFKIRPATKNVPSESKADIKNINLYIGRTYSTERMFWNQRTSTHRWMFGGMAGISSEELTNLNTDDSLLKDNPTNQAYLTLAGGVGYSYKDKINVMFIPIGSDIGFSDTAKKWIYNGNYWWGFGIGLDLSSVFNF